MNMKLFPVAPPPVAPPPCSPSPHLYLCYSSCSFNFCFHSTLIIAAFDPPFSSPGDPGAVDLIDPRANVTVVLSVDGGSLVAQQTIQVIRESNAMEILAQKTIIATELTISYSSMTYVHTQLTWNSSYEQKSNSYT